jgi:hypothetical protein
MTVKSDEINRLVQIAHDDPIIQKRIWNNCASEMRRKYYHNYSPLCLMMPSHGKRLK